VRTEASDRFVRLVRGKTPRVRCPKCEGRRYIDTYGLCDHAPSEHRVAIVCPLCRGDGKV